jgi:hypothetical protein
MRLRLTTFSLAVLAALAGCSEQGGRQAAGPKPGRAGDAELAEAVITAPVPVGVMSVAAARSSAKDGDNIVVFGRVKDFVDGAAVFTFVDRSLKDCKERGDGCPTPWDYCCESKEALTSNSATVKIVGKGTAPIRAGAKGVGGIDHLVDVAAEGTARLDPLGNLAIEARKVYVAAP